MFLKLSILISRILSGLFFNIFPVNKNELIINSFLAIHELGCLNFKNDQLLTNVIKLSSKIRSTYFDDRNYLNVDNLIKKLKKHWRNLDVDDKLESIDHNLLELIKFLSKYAVDLKCLQNVETEKIMNLNERLNSEFWSIYIDFDFIDKKTYLDYKLHNKLDLNPKVNLLIGGVPNEQCLVGLSLARKKKCYADVFTPPKLTKEDSKSIIKHFGIFESSKLIAFYYVY